MFDQPAEKRWLWGMGLYHLQLHQLSHRHLNHRLPIQVQSVTVYVVIDVAG